MSRTLLTLLAVSTMLTATALAEDAVSATAPVGLVVPISLTTLTASATFGISPSMAPVVSETAPSPYIISNAPRALEVTLMLAARHPVLLSTEADVDAARGSLKAARGTRWFTLTGDAEAGVQSYKDEDDDGTAGVGNLGLSLNQPLIDGGRRRGAIQSADERFKGATENLDWQKRQRRYAAASAHINLWLAQELVRNNADNVNQLEEIVSEVRGRLSHSEATVTEIAEAESRLASARSAQSERLAALGNAQAGYLRDVGEAAMRIANPGTGVSLTVGPAHTHPLVAAAQHAVEEAEGLVKQRHAAYSPTLDLRGRASHNAFAGTNRDENASLGQLTLNLGYTFIDHGVTAGETAAAKAARRAAQADLTTTQLEVESAFLNAQSNNTEAERRLEESARAIRENANVIKNLTSEVKQGNRTVRDLLDARRDQLAAANAWAQAYANRVLSTYDLERWQ